MSVRWWIRAAGVVALLVGALVLVPASGSPGAAGAAGTTWSVVPTPNVPVLTPNSVVQPANQLEGVACVTPSDCWAVGFGFVQEAGTAETFQQNLAEHWDGTSWSIVPTSDTSTTQAQQLTGIACPSATDCWAVGWAVPANGGAVENLAEHWDGTAWSIVPTPDASAGINELNGVACLSTSDCWAVGIADVGAGPYTGETLAEHWNGTAWSIVTTPDASGPSVGSNELNGVVCSGTADCWAVGIAFTGTEGPNHTLTEHWDGSAWSVVPSPDTSAAQTNQLSGVACTSSSDCWAVGQGTGSNGEFPQNLAVHWDGHAWSIVTTPDTGPGLTNRLLAVTCVSPVDCWAVGDAAPASQEGSVQSLTEHWDGTEWSIASTPAVGPSTVNSLDATACTSPSNCWAVGWFADPATGEEPETLAEHGPTPAATTTGIASSLDPTRVGQAVTYTATVVPRPDGAGSPTGTVRFADNGSPINGCSAVPLTASGANCTVTYTATGTHTIEAGYSGDADFAGSTSPELGETVASCLFANFDCDLAQADLVDADLAGQDYAWTTFAQGDLSGADLAGSSFLVVSMKQADLAGANLTASKMAVVDLGGANLTDADLSGTSLFLVNVSGVTWSNTVCPDGTNSTADDGTCSGHL